VNAFFSSVGWTLTFCVTFYGVTRALNSIKSLRKDGSVKSWRSRAYEAETKIKTLEVTIVNLKEKIAILEKRPGTYL